MGKVTPEAPLRASLALGKHWVRAVDDDGSTWESVVELKSAGQEVAKVEFKPTTSPAPATTATTGPKALTLPPDQREAATARILALEQEVATHSRELKDWTPVISHEAADRKFKLLTKAKEKLDEFRALLRDCDSDGGYACHRIRGLLGVADARSAADPGRTGEQMAPVTAATLPAPRELYSQAYVDYARGNFDLAIQGYEQYLRAYPETDLSDNAQYWIGECLYSKQKYEEALLAWDEMFRRYPGSDKLPDARFKKGLALERLGRRSQALIEYRTVANRYPSSEAGRKAREKLSQQ